MKNVTPDELEAAVEIVRADNGQPRLHTVREVLDACKLGVINETEARGLLGIKDPAPVEAPAVSETHESFWAMLKRVIVV